MTSGAIVLGTPSPHPPPNQRHDRGWRGTGSLPDQILRTVVTPYPGQTPRLTAHLRMRIGLRRDAEGTVVAALQAAGRFTPDSQPDGLG